MGEPLEEIRVDEIYSGLNNLEYAEEEFEKDIRHLKKFQEKITNLDISTGLNQVNSETNIIQSNSGVSQKSGATGLDLLEIYEEILIEEDDNDLEEIRKIEEGFGFSRSAAHLFYHVTRDKSQSRQDAKEFAAYLDKDAPLSQQNINQAIIYSKALIKVRKMTFEDLDNEKSSLKYFQSRVEDIKDEIVEVNKENRLPLNFKDLYSITKELDQAYLELENLKQLRQLENNYLNQIKGDDYRENMHKIYGKEDGDSVVDEIESIQDIMQQTTIDGINYPLALEEYKQNTYEISDKK